VAGNDPQGVAATGRAQLSSTVVDIVVTDTVKTVTAYPVFLRHFDGESIVVGFGGDVTVEGCVENGNLVGTWKPMGSKFDPSYVRRVVKGCQFRVGPDPFHYLCIDQVSVPEASAAVNHPVPDSLNRRKPSRKEGV
jgi:hypothetical protein